jgi:hypothetical protein
VGADVGEAEWAWLIDQNSQNSASMREVADLPLRRCIDSERQEALERAAVVGEHPDGGVTRAGEIGRGVEHTAEHRLEVEVGDEDTAYVEQPAEAYDIEAGFRQGVRNYTRSTEGRPRRPAGSR